MKKIKPTKREIVFSPQIVKEAIMSGLIEMGYLSVNESDPLPEIHPYRCGQEKNHEIGVKIILK